MPPASSSIQISTGLPCATCTQNDAPSACVVTTHGGSIRRQSEAVRASSAAEAASGVEASTSIAARTASMVSSGTWTWLPRQSQ